MRLGTLLPLGLLICVVFGVLAPPVPAVETHGTFEKNERWGYKVRAPKNWRRRTLRLDEPWIADKFIPDHALRARNPEGEFVTLKPDLWVIGFPHEREKERGVHKEKVGEHTTIITVRNPYKDYMDFVEREKWASTGRGGWFVSREETIEHGGHEVDIIEIKVEKLVRAPLRVVTWVYHCDDVDFAVQLRILEEHYAPNKNVIEGVMKSFREIPRTKPFPKANERKPTSTEEEGRKTLEEIHLERLERINGRIEDEIENLPKGWMVLRSKNFICISQIDKQHTRYVLNYAEEIRKYLDKHFSELGAQQVPPGLIRVFGSTEDERVYQQGTRGWWVDEVGEVTLTFARESAILSEFSSLAGRLTDQYFHIKNENLKWGMPGWIRYGIWGHIRWARPSKRKRMVMARTPSHVRAMAMLFHNDGALPLKDLMTVGADAYGAYEQMEQATSVVHWMLGRGNKGKVKGAIATYLLSLEKIIEEEDEKFETAEEARWKKKAEEEQGSPDADRGKSDEELEREEDERFRQRREKRSGYSEHLKAKYLAIRERALQAAFGHLKDKDWKKLDSAWKRFAKP